MDVRTLSVDDARELAELRRRAFGPNADIADDPAAVSRLHELEDEQRRRHDTASPAEDRHATSVEPLSLPSAESTTDPVGAETDSDAPGDRAPTSSSVPEAGNGSPRRWWRRVPVWSIAAIALVVGAGAGAASTVATAPRADVVLREAPSEGGRGATWQQELRSWGMAPDSAVAFEQFNGVGVWTASSDDGSRCIILENGHGPVNATCAGGGFDPILDVTLYGGGDEFFDAPPPTGTVIRFIARDDTVEVWIRERQSVDASSSETMPSSR